jgi:serine/threonine protein kinase/tetratricopeptide (TPR) repeat protein
MLRKGDVVDHFEIIHLLGEGGMGQVYLARDSVLERNVAIKFLPPEMERDPQTRMRFVREAKSSASLDHPFICKVYETGEVEEKAFIVMEYVEGKTLKDKMEELPLSIAETLRITLEIAEALDEAHKKGIVHRDLKPANIMITPQDHVKVMDFGLAKRVLPKGQENIAATITQSSITAQGAIAGTIAYMSPEQARGEEVDARSDIFSLGIILQEMISGNHPFSKPSAIETLSSILRDPVPQTQVKPRSLNPILGPILNRALAKDRDERYQDVSAFVSDIRKAQKSIVGAPSIFHRPVVLIAAAAIIVLLSVFVILQLTRSRGGPPVAAEPEHISVIIADVQNQTGDPIFDGVIEKALGLSLDGASHISVFDSQQARQQAVRLKPGFEGKIDLEVARLISRRLGINAIVSASIEQKGNGYLIKAWATDPSTSKRITEVDQEINTKTQVLNSVDYITARLRADLGVISEESTESLIRETFTTTSLEAMKAYTNAQDLEAAGNSEEAIKEYLKALDNDPNLGRAYAGLAAIYHNNLQYEKAEEYYLEAMKRIDQMTDREKYRTRGGYYLMKRNYKKAVEEFSLLIEQFPLDASGHTNLALADFYSYDMRSSYEAGLRAVELNPDNIHIQFNLVWYAAGAGEFEVAEKQAKSIIQSNPDFLYAHTILALVELAQGDSDKASETYKQMESKSDYGASMASHGLADIALYRGQWKDAQSILARGIDIDIKNDWKYNAAQKHISMAHAHFFQGNTSAAVQEADRALETFKNEEIVFSAAEVFIQAGEINRARSLAAELNVKVHPVHQSYAKIIGGELSLARGDVPGAASLFQEALGIVDTWLGRFAMGKAYLEAGEYTEAYSEFEACLKRRGEAISVFLDDLPSYHRFPPVYYYLGRSQEGLGSPSASESYQNFLDIKSRSDQDIKDPMVTDAKARVSTSTSP